uniref:Uncharacterized protein n=1 Tax=Anguilla anguilla TaxID=7936 RepID=A0A0E9QNK1_ANGAN
MDAHWLWMEVNAPMEMSFSPYCEM